MNIAVVGLGLIGGSFCRALKKYTKHVVLGIDIDQDVICAALTCGAIDRAITPEQLNEADVVLLSLHPRQTIDFILSHQNHFRPGTVVCDLCGVKAAVTDAVELPLQQKGVCYVGAHPMAGRADWGFGASDETLFQGASFIITNTNQTKEQAVDCIRMLALAVGFGQVVLSTPQEHDRIIAFTSQLAHVISNAYVKSPSAQLQNGFSAGSFRDLSRVAYLNEQMWAPLFMLNREPLLDELDTLLHHLSRYRDALAAGDEQLLLQLLKEGRQAKQSVT